MEFKRKENQFDIEDGDFSFTGQRSDPYGFWTIKGRQGKKPIRFESHYTSAEDAVKAVKKRIRDLTEAPRADAPKVLIA